MRRTLFALACVASWWLPSLAAAQTAVVLPVGGDASLAASRGGEAVLRVQHDLEDSGFTVLFGDALARATSAAHVEACGDPTCAPAMLEALHAELAVGVALWPRNGLVQVSVVLLDAHDAQVSASADGVEGVIGQLTQAALAQARARWAMRDGSPVRVVGAPDGASITVDREPWGTVPHQGSLSPGMHHFVVSADGFVTERRDVDVPAATEPVEIRFDLVPGHDEAATPPAGGGPDVGMMAIGGGLAGVGLALAIVGIANVTQSEHCVSCTATGGTVYVPNTPVDATLIGVGGAAVIGGVILLVVGATSHPDPSVTLTADGFAVHF